MPTEKISITLDSADLRAVQKLARPRRAVSAVIGEAVHEYVRRQDLIQILVDMEKTNPITADERAAGERIWQQTLSSWTQAPSARSPRKKGVSGTRSRKR